MSVDVSVCEQIRCGAISQAQAGPTLLFECAKAGYSGAHTCGWPDCTPYHVAMAANGLCPPAPPMAPVTPPIYVPAVMPQATTTGPPSITGNAITDQGSISPMSLLRPLPQIVPSAPAPQAGAVCDAFTAWVSTNPIFAVGLLVAGYFFLTRK